MAIRISVTRFAFHDRRCVTGIANALYLAARPQRKVAEMKRFFAWGALIFGLLYFALPLIGMTNFSLKMRRARIFLRRLCKGADRSTLSGNLQLFRRDGAFHHRFRVLLVVPTAYWVRLKLPGLRPYIEFITLLPLVIPAIVIVFGYIRLYNTSSWLPLTGTSFGTNLLLMFGYATLALPYMYRAVDTAVFEPSTWPH